MIKRLTHCAIAATLFFISSLTLAQPKFSHVIFFGDSLSDIGNMPESPTLIEPAYQKIALNLFVPISNPILTSSSKTYTVVGTKRQYHFPKHAPQPQPPLRDGKTVAKRNVYSLNWTQFFTEDAKEAGLLNNATIWPWFWWKSHGMPWHISINYAWSGAVTDNLCRNLVYENATNRCNTDSIFTAQAAYRHAGFDQRDRTATSIVQVPGLDRQVGLFLHDSKKYPQIADSKTLYVILIGGNDLNLSMFDLKQHHIFRAFGRVLGGASSRVYRAIMTLIRKRHAKHIVLFNLFDTSQLPYLQTEIWKSGLFAKDEKPQFLHFTRLMTRIYNRQLVHIVQRIKFHHRDVDIQLFDLHNTMNQVQALPTFSSPKTLYLTCLGTDPHLPIHDYVKQHHCRRGNAHFLFWNGAHPANYLHEVIADRLTRQLLR